MTLDEINSEIYRLQEAQRYIAFKDVWSAEDGRKYTEYGNRIWELEQHRAALWTCHAS